jgi:hypothetical protein
MTSHVWQEIIIEPGSAIVKYNKCDRCNSITGVTVDYRINGKIIAGNNPKHQEKIDGDCDLALIRNIQNL